MARSRTGLLATLAALVVSLAAASVAGANSFDQVFKDYQAHGKISPCSHSEAQLQQAKAQIPNDIQAYAPDFLTALQAALDARSGGACATSPSATPSAAAAAAAAASAANATTPPPPGATVTPQPTPDATAAPAVADQAIAHAAQVARASDAGAPAPIVALGVLGALLVLGGAFYGIAHGLAWDPAWARTSRHAFAEAGWRAGNVWSEFADWLRRAR